MNKPNWQLLTTVSVPAKPSGLWTLAWDYVAGPKKLKIEAKATESWTYAPPPASPCTGDGDPRAALDRARCLCPDAPVGALIGKIGGSTGGIKDGQIFVAGQLCVMDLADTVKGVLLLTINDEVAGFAENTGALSVSIYEAL